MNPPTPPLVSVIMANLNGAAHIAQAVRSVLAQSEGRLELIVCDDGSDDDSLARAAAAADGDARLVLLRSAAARTGPAAARNRGLSHARGAWIAVVDNDDFIAPDRLERLIGAAERDNADIVADDLETFYEGGARAPHGHLRGALAQAPAWIGTLDYVRSNIMFGRDAGLGYLKPVFRRQGRHGGAPLYDETLRIGEDYDLVLRMLAAGARMRVYPWRLYHYRKHAASISHRLDLSAIDAMIGANARIQPGADVALARALKQQRSALLRARAFTQLVSAIKARRPGAALAAAAARPDALLLLRYPIAARFTRRRA